MQPRGRWTMGLSGLTAVSLIATVLATGVASEYWHIFRLRCGELVDRRAAARHLGESGSFRSIHALRLTASTDDDRWVRRLAVVALIELTNRHPDGASTRRSP